MIKPALLLPLLVLLPLAPAFAGAETYGHPDQSELLARKAQLESRLDSLQQQGNLYRVELQETWMELGATLQALERHSAATEAYAAAWQATRINGGLEDPQQLVILQRLHDSQRASADWEAADTSAHLIHHIANRAHAPGSRERLEALLQLGRWKLLAARDGLLPNPLLAAVNAAELFQQEITRLEAMNPGPQHKLQLATLHLEKASADYLVASTIRDQPLQEFNTGSQPATTTMVQCQTIRLPNGLIQQLCTPVEVANLDFYIDPSNRKNQEMWRYLEKMRAGIQQAFGQLSQETQYTSERDLLLQDMQGLTAAYNEFVTGKTR
jgi:hypothetical protein